MHQRKKKKIKNIFWYTRQEERIIEYNKCKDPKERSKIYETRIKFPFEKLMKM